ncbi:hypothetical protein AURDEDRAFT_130594 [Auricularia subglabra TFB-10046 SS5]|uniref:MYND-type domain-containing protein n=1 Tax=Auricularia subglabra (strain TFB-10046 / SS5) TaxID=717982 RepID=J0WTC5_AURST|nr:hypothetical protein AURDEDRAFT_130594 [Auricularia subglabra TFB-10046 SS5]
MHTPTRRSVMRDLHTHGLDVDKDGFDEGIVRWADNLAAALQPVFSPTICPGCLSSFCQIMEHKNTIVYVLQTKCHAFWDATMAFVAAEWTSERRHAVSELLRRTGAQCSRCQAHSCCAADIAQIVAAPSVFDLIFRLACSYLRVGVTHGVEREKRFISTRGRWPTSAEQLFPYGAERTVSNLVAQLTTNSCAEMVLFSFISLHRPLAFPAFMKAPNRARIISYLVARFTACVSEFNADLARLRQPVIPAVRKRLVLQHIQTYQLTANMFLVVCFGPEHGPDAHWEFCHQHELELFHAFDKMASLLPDDAGDEHEMMAYLGTKLWFMLQTNPRLAAEAGPPPAYIRGVESLTGLQDPYRALCLYIQFRTRIRGCQRPGCDKTVHDKTTPGGFPRCSMCRAVRYCSRECQDADWRCGAVPHKAVCRILRDLSAFVPVAERIKATEFCAACTEHAFPLEHVDKLIAWATEGKCTPNYAGGAKQTAEVHWFMMGDAVALAEPLPETARS